DLRRELPRRGSPASHSGGGGEDGFGGAEQRRLRCAAPIAPDIPPREAGFTGTPGRGHPLPPPRRGLPPPPTPRSRPHGDPGPPAPPPPASPQTPPTSHPVKQASRGPRVAGTPSPGFAGYSPDFPPREAGFTGTPRRRHPLPRLRRVLPRLSTP